MKKIKFPRGAFAAVVYDNSTVSIDDFPSYGGVLLSALLESYNYLPKLFSSWVSNFGCHIPNIDNYKTISVYTIEGNFCFSYDRNLNLIANNLDLTNNYSKQLFDFVRNKVKELKAKK